MSAGTRRPTVLVTGANRGLGLEFVRQYAADRWRVLAFCRAASDALHRIATEHDVRIETVDVSDFAQIDRAAATLRDEAVDVMINNAGQFGPKLEADNDPRQTFGQMDYDIWSNLFRVNTLAPYKMVEAFHPQLTAGDQRKVVTLSSAVSSISGAEPTATAYRCSKTAVNMAMATLAKRLADDEISVLTLCPGWVRTEMGGDAAPIEPVDSVLGMRARISELSLDSTGQFLRYNGDVIPW